MLKYDRQSAQRPRRFARGERRGVWMLLLMLGMVIMLMQQLRRPETAAFLGHLFGAPPAEPPSPSDLHGELHAGKKITPAVDVSQPSWSAVEDNAPFLSKEHDAWFALFKTVQTEEQHDLSRRSLGEKAYAQLMSRPQAYRGQVVRVLGRIVRESVKSAPQNSLGIREYHQLVLAPARGGGLPMILYALELPADFPRGDGTATDVAVDALFFKNWSFTDGEEMALAPVLVTRTLSWAAPPLAAERKSAASSSGRGGLAKGIGVASVVATAFVILATAKTRRRPRRSEVRVDFGSLERDA